MKESSTPSKFSKWKRPLIGGILSAATAVASLIISWLTPESDGLFFLKLPLIFIIALGVDNLIFITLGGFLIWFFLGLGITYLVSSNKKAVRWWLLLFTLAFLVLPLLAYFVYFAFIFN